ncbi:DapH/DapD/GlmU-related protein [Butyrivibrio sp. AE2032]|uniref:DapH/DapD/GlmU-related protein n=1 Tax=Butyrivibrio sp. AE2032 TaxID=1458463 RepID=UPI000689F557|nr:DapH/DapD/GlmU-related protein [Butyrivibrio sp. AE2032]
MLAPGVLLTTVSHPLFSDQRIIKPFKNSFEPYGRGNIEINKPINIGDNVWIAAYSVICGGVTIGKNSVIGAGSIVTRDIPPNVLAMGTPCKVVREITEEDRILDDYFNGI